MAKLNKPLHPTASDTAIERKALKLVQHQRHEQREHAHVKDVIAGWGPRPKKPFSQWTTQETSRDWVPPSDPDQFVPGGAEGEKVLRKLAQRGTVKLFNAIRVSRHSAFPFPSLRARQLTLTSVFSQAAQGTTEEDLIASARAKPSQPPPASIADELRRKALPQGNAAAPAAKTSRSGSATTSSMPPNEGQDLSHVPNLFGTQAKEAARKHTPTASLRSSPTVEPVYTDGWLVFPTVANLSKESFLSILKGKPNA